MTPASAIAPAVSAMTRFSGDSSRSWPSSVLSFSPVFAGRTMIVGSLAAGALEQHVVVEGVQRLALFEHHVVGDVHDVVDRPHPGVLEPRPHPARRGPTVTSRMIVAV